MFKIIQRPVRFIQTEKNSKIDAPSSADKIGLMWNILSTPSTIGNKEEEEDLQNIPIRNSYLLSHTNPLNDLKLSREIRRDMDSGKTFEKSNIYQVPSLRVDSNYGSDQVSANGDRIYSNKLMTFGNFRRTFTQESTLSNILSTQSPPTRRFQNGERRNLDLCN